MKVTRLNWAGIVLAFSVAGCTSNAGGPPSVASVNPAAQSALQFSVGTANIAGTATGMNVVVTNRQPNGDSGVLLDTPKLTGTFVLPAAAADASASKTTGATAAAGPSSGEISGSLCGGTPCITGTPQTAPGSAPPFPSTFGTSGGVFGLAFAPANSTATNTTNIYQPYQVPLYGTKLFTPWGGPPAYDPAKGGKGTRDGTFADTTQAILGVSLGLDIFQGVTVNPGAYNLSINIPTVDSSQTVSSSFTLGGTTALATPTVNGITFDGTGQASIAYTLPAGIVGAYVEVIDNGPSNCNGAGNLNLYGAQTTGNPTAKPRTTTYYTFWVTASGTVTVQNSNSPGPPGSSFPAICTTAQNTASPIATGSTSVPDSVTAFVIGFDYDHYSLTYNKPLNSAYPQKPALPASADVAVSAALNATSP